MEFLGIDIGGSGIKGAVVDPESGEMVSERYRLDTPQPATTEAVVETVAAIVSHFEWKNAVGCGFPGVVRRGRVLTAANVSKSWLEVQAEEALRKATGCRFTMANDADLAGLAEMRFGAGQGRDGLVAVFTLGTGIGSALFLDGRLVPNTELGHLEIDGREAERWASAKVREDEDLSWKSWASRVDRYLDRIQGYLWPELIILGGGVSKRHEKFFPYLEVDCEVVPAKLRNRAGIVGAALAAAEAAGERDF